MPTKQTVEHKYELIARSIEKMVDENVLKTGDRLPSVRMLSKQYGINAGTVFQAYYLLEARGLIEARPRSGYYVRFTKKQLPQVPAVNQHFYPLTKTSARELIASMFDNLGSKDLIQFSLGSPHIDLLPSAKLNKCILYALRTNESCLHYEDTQGNVELRKQLAKLSFWWNGKIKKEDIIITSGCLEALGMCLKAVARPGDTIAIQSPAYFGTIQLLSSLDLNIVEVPSTYTDCVSLSALEQLIKKHNVKACLFVTNFNNPDGLSLADDTKQALVQLLTRHCIPLIEDDIYGELFFGDQRPKTCKTFDKNGWVLYCSSFSKSLAPGYRVGWCIPGRFKEQIKQAKLNNNISGTTITQTALARFLSIGRYEYHLKRLRQALQTQYLNYLQSIIRHFPMDIRVSQPKGGFVLWIELNKTVDGNELYIEALKSGIAIAPGQIFSSQNHYSNYIRISYGKPFDEKVDKAIATLGRLLHRIRE